MSETKSSSSLLPKFELIFIAVFFIAFLFWSVSKCRSTSARYEAQVISEQEDTIAAAAPAPAATPATNPTNTTAAPAASTTPATAATGLTTLYVCLPDLNLRRGPSLDSTTISKLPLFEPVFFLNEVTEFTQEINLGKQTVNEPWIKVRTKEGRDGWVYGAGVSYYKRKHPGAS